MRKIIFIVIFFNYSCSNCNRELKDIHNNKLIDTSGIEEVSLYCNFFYKSIKDEYPLSSYSRLHVSIEEVIKTKSSFILIRNTDTINKIKEIFLENYTILDSVKDKYKKQGDFFLVLKKANTSDFLSFSFDSILVYNEKYSLKYSYDPIKKFFEYMGVQGIDCYSDSSLFIAGKDFKK